MSVPGQADLQTRFIYDGNQVLFQFDGTGNGSGSGVGNDPLTIGNLGHRYLWGPGVDQLLADEHVSSVTTPGTVYWPLTDAQNTIRDVAVFDVWTNTTTVVDHRVYTAYGQLASETSAVDCVFGFMGQFDDPATAARAHLRRLVRSGGWAMDE